MADSKRPFCFECGGQLVHLNGVAVYAVRDYHGTQVKMHKDCAKWWDDDEAETNVTARKREEPRHD